MRAEDRAYFRSQLEAASDALGLFRDRLNELDSGMRSDDGAGTVAARGQLDTAIERLESAMCFVAEAAAKLPRATVTIG